VSFADTGILKIKPIEPLRPKSTYVDRLDVAVKINV